MKWADIKERVDAEEDLTKKWELVKDAIDREDPAKKWENLELLKGAWKSEIFSGTELWLL